MTCLVKRTFDMFSEKNISKLLKIKRLDKNEFMKKVGISSSHFRLIEERRIKPSKTLTIKIANVLNCKIEDIVNKNENWKIDEVKILYENINKTLLDKKFLKQTEEIKNKLKNIKRDCDIMDSKLLSQHERIDYVKHINRNIFRYFDKHFWEIWKRFQQFDKNNYNLHKIYYQIALYEYLSLDSFNEYIYEKPLGYAGDFIMMNYLYENDYTGESIFSKLIHRYTCSVPVARANINRKFYFQQKIKDTFLKLKNNVDILNVACGPAVEMLEYIEYENLPEKYNFCFFDMEDLALRQIKEKINLIERSKNKKVNATYIKGNVLDLIKNKMLLNYLKEKDLIYCAGLIDYISDKIASKVIEILFQCLKKNGTLIIGNVSSKNPSRSYMEIMGEWHVNHRNSQRMLSLANRITEARSIYVEKEPTTGMNFFLVIRK